MSLAREECIFPTFFVYLLRHNFKKLYSRPRERKNKISNFSTIYSHDKNCTEYITCAEGITKTRQN